MPCFCQIFNKSKQYRPVKSKTGSPQTNANVGDGTADNPTGHVPQENNSSGPVSASAVVQLKAKVWSLQNSLSDSTVINNNMQEAITETVAEKYRLLDELNQAKTEAALAEAQQDEERNRHARERDKFLREIDSYRSKINELSCLVEKIAEQNIELKQQLLEANDTVCRVARKYMKLKSIEC
ncbi:hypothetical protein pipiens_010551 [Culex pipiens pipiens]|uniref:Uncharacterized protein n=1 Tax=Culex pipiens pipiens TaxID=38569 RepID=A0ABD1D9Z2_CULPP